jgi:thioredoxin
MSIDITTSAVRPVAAAEFENEVLKAEQPVLVDVWAPWCGPCRRLASVVERVAEVFADRLKVVKCNLDSNPDIGDKFNVMSIPTLLFFKGGRLIANNVGFLRESELTAKVEEFLGR